MPNSETPSALRLKISTPASPFDQPGLSPPKALRIAFARAAESAAEMEASIAGFVEERLDLAAIAERLVEPHLIFSTKVPGGAVGLAFWNTQAVSAFIEQLITGRIVPSAAENRTPTPTDAAVVGGVLNLIFSYFDAELKPIVSPPPVQGFRRSGVLEDVRAVAMALEDIDYRVYRLSLDLGKGAKTGMLHLIFPWAPPGANSGNLDTESWNSLWQSAVSDAQAPIYAILERVQIPLDEITRFEVGTNVPVSTEAIGAVSLEGEGNQQVATGRLGQSNGHRAVLITIADRTSMSPGAEAAFQNAEPKQRPVPSLVPAEGVVGAEENSSTSSKNMLETTDDSDGVSVT